MTFRDFSAFLQKLEKTASRNAMTEILADLFKKADENEIDKMCYLLLGRLAPKFAGVEFQFAEKMMIRAIGRAVNVQETEVKKEFKKLGDLGDVVNNLKFKIAKGKSGNKNLSIIEVYNKLFELAQEGGQGSVERKIVHMIELLKTLDPLSAKYAVRMVLGILRIGFSDMTILDGLSWMKRGDKSLRKDLENAYNNSTDIGLIAKTFKKGGLGAIGKIDVVPGIPIRPQQSERLETAEKIIEKLGKCAVEYKLDGFRAQVHVLNFKFQISNFKFRQKQKQLLLGKEKEEKNVRIFSRNLEDTTHMFPEVAEAAGRLKVDSAVLDGEVIGIDPKKGTFLPFQQTAQRKRKHDIVEMAKKIPVKFFAFDILYINGKSMLDKKFKERRKLLEEILR